MIFIKKNNGWVVRKYEGIRRHGFVLPQENGYTTFKSEVCNYIDFVGSCMKIEPFIIDTAKKMAKELYWENSRPSTLAGVFVLMAGSIHGLAFKEFLIDLAHEQRKMPSTYTYWKEQLGSRFGWN